MFNSIALLTDSAINVQEGGLLNIQSELKRDATLTLHCEILLSAACEH